MIKKIIFENEEEFGEIFEIQIENLEAGASFPYYDNCEPPGILGYAT